MHRVFIAIRPPEQLVTRIQELQSRLGKLEIPVKWNLPEELFLTLNYVGRIDPVLLHTLQFKTLPDIISSYRPFSLSFPFVEGMYRRHESSFIYLLPGGDLATLKDIQTDITIALNKANLPQDRRFQPMLPLGELEKSDHETTKERLQRLDSFEYSSGETFEIDHLTLMESITSKAGVSYKKLARFRLSTA